MGGGWQSICQNNLPLRVSIYVHPAAVIRQSWWSGAGGGECIQGLIKTFMLIPRHGIKKRRGREGGINIDVAV